MRSRSAEPDWPASQALVRSPAVGKVCIIGAGSSGIAACQVLHARGIPFDCFETGSGVGGNWRYDNDNGMSSAYRSLFINTSREMMEYASLPDAGGLSGLPAPHADRRLLRRLRGSLRVPRPDPLPHRGHVGGAATAAGAGRSRSTTARPTTYDAVMVANGHHWNPKLARARLPRPGGLPRRAAPLAPLPRARRALRGPQRARARHRQLGHRHRGGDLARVEDDLSRHAPRRARAAQVHRRHAHRPARRRSG